MSKKKQTIIGRLFERMFDITDKLGDKWQDYALTTIEPRKRDLIEALSKYNENPTPENHKLLRGESYNYYKTLDMTGEYERYNTLDETIEDEISRIIDTVPEPNMQTLTVNSNASNLEERKRRERNRETRRGTSRTGGKKHRKHIRRTIKK